MQVREKLRIVQGCKAPAIQSGFFDQGNDLSNFTKIGYSNEREDYRKERYMFIRLKCLNLVNRLHLTGKTN